MADKFLTLIVTAAHADFARELAGSFGEGGRGMWTTPLSQSGNEPATHYISSGLLPAKFAEMVPTQTWEQDEQGNWTMVSSTPGNPAAVYAVAQQQGVPCTLQEVTDTLTSSDVTEQPPFTAMGRLGLTIINPPDV